MKNDLIMKYGLNEIHSLINHYIDDDFELINSILKGKHIPWFYGFNGDKPFDKVEDIVPKYIENIINYLKIY